MTKMTAVRAHELLDYTPDTGVFVWRSPAGQGGKIPAGTKAGALNGDGRRYLRLDRGSYCASQVAWLMTHGEWPSENVIFLNGLHDDTRATNLALASSVEKPDLSVIELTQAELKRQLDYEEATGVFTWKRTGRRGVRYGRIAGNLDPTTGHRKIRLNEREYLAQRLAWLYVNGEWPSRPLRFLDGNQANAAISNLALPEFDTSTVEGKKDYQRNYRKRHFEVLRGSDLRKDFGISMDVYNMLFKRQNGVCAICKQPETAIRNDKVKWMAVDHCHSTMKIRGLLCQKCNSMLGQANDSAATLHAGGDYVEKDHAIEIDGEPVYIVKKGTA